MSTATLPENEAAESVELTPEQQAERDTLMQHIASDGITESQEHIDRILDDIVTGKNLKEEPASPTALRLDQWDIRRGKEIADHKKMKEHEIDELEAADFHASCFHYSPELHPKPVDPLRSEYLKQMFDTLEYQKLHDQTMGDDFASEVASHHFGVAYATLRKQQKEIDQKNQQRADKGLPPLSGAAGQPNHMGAIAKAIGGAQQEVQEYADACEAMGIGHGTGEGNASGRIDPTRINKLMGRIKNSQNLKKIIEWAGRFKIVASSCQRAKVTIGNDELVGIVPDNAIERMLPQEFVYMDDPVSEVYFFAKYLERKTLCREFQAREPQGRGPIVVIVDESGSMGGQRIETAKGMMLAIGWIARKQKRWLTLAAFCGGTQSRIETFPTGNWDENKMLAWLEAFMGGGTELHVPFRVVPEYLDKLPGCPKGKIDFIILTDGDMSCSDELKQHFLKWKAANQARLLSIIIASSPGILGTLSDEVYQVNTLTLDCDAAKAAFSI